MEIYGTFTRRNLMHDTIIEQNGVMSAIFGG